MHTFYVRKDTFASALSPLWRSHIQPEIVVSRPPELPTLAPLVVMLGVTVDTRKGQYLRQLAGADGPQDLRSCEEERGTIRQEAQHSPHLDLC